VLVIKTSNDAGLGNRLQAMTSAFLFAIVTKRLLLVDWAENADTIVRALLISRSLPCAMQQRCHLCQQNNVPFSVSLCVNAAMFFFSDFSVFLAHIW
jgi:hypothetical protein